MSLAATREDQDAGSQPALRASDSTIRRIIVVDDRPDTFHGLQSALAEAEDETSPDPITWALESVPDGESALAALAREPADVLIAEEQLTPMDGVTLLTRVREQYPTTIRMIMSATTRPGLATIVSHRLLTKPCDPRELSVLVRRSCALHARTAQIQAFRRTMATTTLPSRPGLYMELNRVLSDPDWSPGEISEVVEHDVAMSAKVLQLANSALFGLASAVTTVRDAVVYLGVDTIRSLALTAEAFGKLTPRHSGSFSLDRFQTHAMHVAALTKAILPAGRGQQEAVTAALLHDIGKLVLISDGSSRWADVNRIACERDLPLHVVELEHDGVTHADLGAHLLSLWGLPDGIVEAVAHHHDPETVAGLMLDGVVAVHIANALTNELSPPPADGPPPAQLDDELIARLGLEARLELWRHQARQILGADSGRIGVSKR